MANKLKARSCISCSFLVNYDNIYNEFKPLKQKDRNRYASVPEHFEGYTFCFQEQWNRLPRTEEWKSRVVLDESLGLADNNPLHYVRDHDGKWVNLMIHKCKHFHHYKGYVVQRPEYISHRMQATIEKRRFLILIVIGILGLFLTIALHLFD